MMDTCAVCGEPIHRRTNVAHRSDQQDQASIEGRPWLHLHGMAYEQRGFDPHDARPIQVEGE